MRITLDNVRSEDRAAALELVDGLLASDDVKHGVRNGWALQSRTGRFLYAWKTKRGVTVRAEQQEQAS